MNNTSVGILIIGIATLIGFMIFSFTEALSTITNSICTHGPDCPMWDTIDYQTNVSTGIMVFVAALGLYLTFSGKEPPVPREFLENPATKGYSAVMNTLSSDERALLQKIIDARGALFQSDLVDETQFNKSKVSRLLDRLEGKALVERRRRGMSNIIILRH
ncbi:MAG: MarR family transcriptional regulator [Theionarchaea archaeon]|nr:MarR family transcriptional regulator [Theionarchaea archaeon]MBU7035011.1 MarR family transcriptional regulator [Theionarchaea archaeon]MBU7040329.1 MarR family transcriptional regulator [Theionarchaea archaeon]